jgi:hypothetical protein
MSHVELTILSLSPSLFMFKLWIAFRLRPVYDFEQGKVESRALGVNRREATTSLTLFLSKGKHQCIPSHHSFCFITIFTS